MAKYQSLFTKGEVVETFGGGLIDKFGMPPFSVFDARQGEWQSRKAAWLSIGIKSELGRSENLLKYSDTILEPDPKKRAAANKVASFRDQDKQLVLMGSGKQRVMAGGHDVTDKMPLTAAELERQRPKGKATAVDYGSGGPAQLARELKTRATAIPGDPGAKGGGAWKHKTEQGYKTLEQIETGESASLKGGLTWSTSAHPYDGAQGSESQQTGTSIFDPVLCELFYRWFVPEDGNIIDPFCGGSVRGVVASRLGYKYTGFDLRQEQVDANKEQGRILCKANQPKWVCDDALNVGKHVKPGTMDAIFSCPPYANLEQYSEDPKDLSTMGYPDFLDAYERIIKAAAKTLKDNSFACFVVGEVRGKDGNCLGFVPDTITAFENAGLRLYNDAILITAIGSLSIRVGKQFTATRKLGRTHQYVLVFLKGDSRKAVAAIDESKAWKKAK